MLSSWFLVLSWLTVVRELLLGLGKEKRSYTFCHNPPHLPRLKEKNKTKREFRGERFREKKKKREPVSARGTFPMLGEHDNNRTTETT